MAVYMARDKGWAEFQRLVQIMQFTQTKAARADFRRRILNEVVEPLAEQIRAAGRSSDGQSRIAAASVKAKGGVKPKLLGGSGGGLPATLFWGAEFGGQRKRAIRTARISKVNPPFVVRQTTQQFRPHRGTEGYWFHPTLRANLNAAMNGMFRIVVEDLGLDALVGVGERGRAA